MKKRNAILISFIISIFFFLSCNDEKEVNMGHGYYYIPFREATFDATMFGGNGIFKYKDSLTLPIIYPNITDYKYSTNYITIKQEFDFAEMRILLKSMIFHPVYFNYDKDFVPLEETYVKNAPNFDNDGLEEKYINSIMHKDLYINKIMEHKKNYYIIDKEKYKLMGPLTKAEFDEKMEVMGLSDKLKLD